MSLFRFFRAVVLTAGAGILTAQTDPGPRSGPADAGGFYTTLKASEQALFSEGQTRFQEVDSVSGTIESGSGLGPTFNGNSCAMCHAQPSVGGSSPGLKSPQKPIPNPQVALATLDHATTGASPYTGMSNVTYHPYSDFALHHMGSNLADGISQGAAGPDEFRTAPLWGLGQRLFFLHDGRTADLLAAIQAHFSPGSDCVSAQVSAQFKANAGLFHPFAQSFACGSEANQVIQNFQVLRTADKQDLINFLRSL